MTDTYHDTSKTTGGPGAPDPHRGDRQETDTSRAMAAALSALAAGDADREEVVAGLRRDGVDALDVLATLFARNARLSRPSGERIDVQNFVTDSGPRVPTSPHKIPNQPFLLRGTLYDPADISRFDARELHFVHTGGEHLLAIDDRSIMENWWQTSYLTSAARGARAPAAVSVDTAASDPYDPYNPWDTDGINTGIDNGPHYVSHGHWKTVPAPAPVEHTNFYEHPNFQGDRLELRASQGAISNLLNESKGFLGSDDWNDKIDSIEMVRTEVTVLYEDINFGGRSLTFTQTVGAVGWFNDLTSSVRTWGSTPWTGTMQQWVVDGVEKKW